MKQLGHSCLKQVFAIRYCQSIAIIIIKISDTDFKFMSTVGLPSSVFVCVLLVS